MSGYDTCPGCDGRKSKVAQLCMPCRKATSIGDKAPNWRGGAEPCPDCGGAKDRAAKRCRPCSAIARSKFQDPEHLRGREWQRAFRQTPNGKRHVLAMNLKKFGLTPETYDELLAEQGGVCAACRQPESVQRDGQPLRLSIDHDHACCPGQYSCGKCVRGLLCQGCNRALGLLGDSPERAEALAAYVRQSVGGDAR